MTPEADPPPDLGPEITPVAKPADPAESLKLIKNQAVEVDTDSDRESKALDNYRKSEELSGLRQDRKQRLFFGWTLFSLAVTWLVFVGITLWFAALKWHGAFVISDTVLVALLGTTTISVLGLLTTVALYLFPKK